MPTLRNPRHERFARLLASGKTATDAYELAGYKSNRFNAAAMARNPEISARVTQINTVAAERAAVTVESLINEAEQARCGAMAAGQYAAAIAAIKEKGVLSGQRVERRESGSPGEFAELSAGGYDLSREMKIRRLSAAEWGPPEASRIMRSERT
jgi:phage terminase small subunit